MIYQGSDKVVLNIYVYENNKPVILTGTTISVTVEAGTRKFVKSATVVNTYLAQVILTADDLSSAGTYYAQASVGFPDGSLIKSDESSFPVGASL